MDLADVNDCITDVAGLRSIYREPGAIPAGKEFSVIDATTATFIDRCPFLVIATTDAAKQKTQLSGATGGPGEHTEEMSTDTPSTPSQQRDTEAVARSYMASFASGDPDMVAAHVAADFVNEHTAALGSGCTGRDAYRERLPGFLRDMAGLVYDVEHVVIDGSTAAVFYTMTARWQGETPIRVRGAQRLVVEAGLITHRVDYWDSKVFLDQLETDAT